MLGCRNCDLQHPAPIPMVLSLVKTVPVFVDTCSALDFSSCLMKHDMASRTPSLYLQSTFCQHHPHVSDGETEAGPVVSDHRDHQQCQEHKPGLLPHSSVHQPWDTPSQQRQLSYCTEIFSWWQIVIFAGGRVLFHHAFEQGYSFSLANSKLMEICHFSCNLESNSWNSFSF